MLSGADIRRQIIESAQTSIRRADFSRPENPMPADQKIEIGKALEAVTKMTGWAIIEQYMEKQEDILNLIISDKLTEEQRKTKRCIAAAFLKFNKWIADSIAEKDKILEEERLKHEAKNVQKEEIDEG